MPSDDEPTYEYAIELPGQGWLFVFSPGSIGSFSLAEQPAPVADNLTDAVEVLRRTRNFYDRIGAAVVAAQLRLVVRSITVVRSGWEEVTA